MNKNEYLNKVEQAVAYFKNVSLKDLLITRRQMNNFGMASLALSHFMPSIDSMHHENIIRDIFTFQRITVLGQQYPAIINDVALPEKAGKKLEDLKTNPHIITTFHFGSYRLINTLLLEYDVPFSLVISSATITQQSKDFLQACKEVYKKSFTVIDAESPSSAISMIKEIKKGNSLVIYLDGNTGAGGKKAKTDSICSIPFLAGDLVVRKGAGYISYIAKVPVFNALCCVRNYYEYGFEFSDPVVPDERADRETYVLHAMSNVYTYFAGLLKQHPQQWEAWLYIYKNIDQASSKQNNPAATEHRRGTLQYDPAKSLRFNLDRFSLFYMPTGSYILDKQSLLSYPLDQDAYSLLADCLIEEACEISRSDMPIAERLVSNSILIQQ